MNPVMSEVAILPATWRDFRAVRQLEKVCFPLDAWPFWDVFGVLTLPDVVRLKAINESGLVGFIAVDIRTHKDLAWIATICVDPEYRRRGVATRLIQESETQLTVSVIKLSVRATNRGAQRLYANLGYREVDRWRGYYQGGEDAVVMEKAI